MTVHVSVRSISALLVLLGGGHRETNDVNDDA